MSKVAIKTKCKSVHSSSGGLITQEGYEIWVCKEQDAWVEATGSGVGFHNGVPVDVKVFNSKDDAEAFIKTWKGHPWYYVPNGEYELVEVEPQYKQTTVGYKDKYSEQ